MAPHPRLLYPYPTNPTSCTTSCSPSCAFYLLCSSLPPLLPSPPPPLPPPPPTLTPPHPFSSTSGTTIHLHSPRLPLPVLLLAASLLTLSLLLLFSLLLHLLLRRLRQRHRDNNNIRTTISTAITNQNQDPHFVWYIRTVGLDERAIANITAWVYKGEGGGVGGSCAVCLADFRDGEMLRLLPKCGHAFHVGCIDTWLRARVSCPLCRAPVVLSDANVTATDSENNVAVGVSENSVSELPGLSLQSSGRDEDGGVYDNEVGSNVLMEQQRSRTGRRSASMGSLPLVALMLRQDIEERDGMEGKQLEFDQGSGSKSREEEEEDDPVKNVELQKVSLELEAVEIERSMSCNGTTFFLSRYGGPRSSILPSRSLRDESDISR